MSDKNLNAELHDALNEFSARRHRAPNLLLISSPLFPELDATLLAPGSLYRGIHYMILDAPHNAPRFRFMWVLS